MTYDPTRGVAISTTPGQASNQGVGHGVTIQCYVDIREAAPGVNGPYIFGQLALDPDMIGEEMIWAWDGMAAGSGIVAVDNVLVGPPDASTGAMHLPRPLHMAKGVQRASAPPGGNQSNVTVYDDGHGGIMWAFYRRSGTVADEGLPPSILGSSNPGAFRWIGTASYLVTPNGPPPVPSGPVDLTVLATAPLITSQPPSALTVPNPFPGVVAQVGNVYVCTAPGVFTMVPYSACDAAGSWTPEEWLAEVAVAPGSWDHAADPRP